VERGDALTGLESESGSAYRVVSAATETINGVQCSRWRWPGTHSPIPLQLGAMWIRTPSQATSTWDQHVEAELIICVGGEGTILFRQADGVAIRPGEVLLIPPEQAHAYSAGVDDLVVASVFWEERVPSLQ